MIGCKGKGSNFFFTFKELAFVTGNNHFVDILKEGGLVVTRSKDFIGSSLPIEVASTLSFM